MTTPNPAAEPIRQRIQEIQETIQVCRMVGDSEEESRNQEQLRLLEQRLRELE